jgi:predicted transcriptional regulator
LTAVLEPPVATEPTLDELGEGARNEHLLALEAGEAQALHRLRSGEFLIAARARFGHGEWMDWLDANWPFHHTAACRYMREASGGSFARNADLRADASRMAKEGARRVEIAQALGVDRGTVWKWLDPEKESQHREYMRKRARTRRAAKKALARAERNAAMSEAGGEIHKAYSNVRLALEALQRLHDEDQSPEARALVNEAMAALYKAEEKIEQRRRLA